MFHNHHYHSSSTQENTSAKPKTHLAAPRSPTVCLSSYLLTHLHQGDHCAFLSWVLVIFCIFLLLCHFPISISLSPGEFTGFANIASMQRLANVTTHSVLVVWRSPRSQERWEIFLWNAQYFVKRICWPMSPPLADLSLAFFWQWRVIRVHSGKKGETSWIFTNFSGLELQKTLWIKTFYRPQFGFQVCWKALIFFVSTYRCPPSIYVKCQLPMLPPDCPPPPPDTSCPGCPAAPPSPSPSPLSTIRSFIHQPILKRSKLTLVPGPLLDIQAFARKI